MGFTKQAQTLIIANKSPRYLKLQSRRLINAGKPARRRTKGGYATPRATPAFVGVPAAVAAFIDLPAGIARFRVGCAPIIDCASGICGRCG